MNPQPDSFIINVSTIGFVLLVLYFVVTSKRNPNFLSNDLIEVLYEVPTQQKVVAAPRVIHPPKVKNTIKNPKPKTQQNTKPVVVHKTKQEETPIVKPQPKPKLTKNTFTSFHEDCVNALMSLGMKKKEAVNTVIDVCNKHDITCIEDFIRKAFVPNEYYRPSN
jgi:hypothetical protein